MTAPGVPKPTREKMTAARAALILAEYPDADLSAFDVAGDVEEIAIEAAAKSLAATGAKMRDALQIADAPARKRGGK